MKVLRIVLSALLIGATGWMMIRDVMSRQYFQISLEVSPQKAEQLEELDRLGKLRQDFQIFSRENAIIAQRKITGWDLAGDDTLLESIQLWAKEWNEQESTWNELQSKSTKTANARIENQVANLKLEISAYENLKYQLSQALLDEPVAMATPNTFENQESKIIEQSFSAQPKMVPKKPEMEEQSKVDDQASGNLEASEPAIKVEDAKNGEPVEQELDAKNESRLPNEMDILDENSRFDDTEDEETRLGDAEQQVLSDNPSTVENTSPATEANTTIPLEIPTIVEKSISAPSSIQDNPPALPLEDLIQNSITTVKNEITQNNLLQFESIHQALDQQRKNTSLIISQQQVKMATWLEGQFAQLRSMDQWQSLQWKRKLELSLEELQIKIRQLERELQQALPVKLEARPVKLHISEHKKELPLRELRHGYRFLLLGLVLCFALNLLWEIFSQRRQL